MTEVQKIKSAVESLLAEKEELQVTPHTRHQIATLKEVLLMFPDETPLPEEQEAQREAAVEMVLILTRIATGAEMQQQQQRDFLEDRIGAGSEMWDGIYQRFSDGVDAVNKETYANLGRALMRALRYGAVTIPAANAESGE